MVTTVSELAVKLQRIELEVAEARRDLKQLKLNQKIQTPEEWRAARLAQVIAANEKLRPTIDAAIAEMGISGQPIGAERVQEILASHGIKPEENLLSRGIIEMREE